jgi:hypothetical protein
MPKYIVAVSEEITTKVEIEAVSFTDAGDFAIQLITDEDNSCTKEVTRDRIEVIQMTRIGD